MKTTLFPALLQI